MILQIYIAIFLICIYLVDYGKCSSRKEIICNGHTFSPKCGPNAVLIVKSARYGRIEEGNCKVKNLGYLGCSNDVGEVLSAECSGKRSCSVFVGDKLSSSDPCMQLTKYLEVEFICQQIVDSGVSQCYQCEGIIITASSGYMSSDITYKTKCGNAICPWVIKANKGQTISFKLYSFPDKTIDQMNTNCLRYAIIKEQDGEQFEVCRNFKSDSQVYISKSNKVWLHLVNENKGNFLIHYTFVGCEDIVKDDMIFLRQNNGAQIQCRKNKRIYNLNCIGTEWNDLENITCSDEVDENYDSSELSLDLLAMLISSLCFMIACFTIVLGLWCFCRKTSSLDDPITFVPIKEDISNDTICTITSNRNDMYLFEKLRQLE